MGSLTRLALGLRGRARSLRTFLAVAKGQSVSELAPPVPQVNGPAFTAALSKCIEFGPVDAVRELTSQSNGRLMLPILLER
jgi:hypothetical protein